MRNNNYLSLINFKVMLHLQWVFSFKMNTMLDVQILISFLSILLYFFFEIQNNWCRLCNDRYETINHIMSEWSKLVQRLDTIGWARWSTGNYAGRLLRMIICLHWMMYWGQVLILDYFFADCILPILWKCYVEECADSDPCDLNTDL